MLLEIGFDIELDVSAPSALVHMLHVHPSRENDLIFPSNVSNAQALPTQIYTDAFGNVCGKVNIPDGVSVVRLHNQNLIIDSGIAEIWSPRAAQLDVRQLPPEVLQFLLASRYCEVDSELMQFAWNQFGGISNGAERVDAVCNFVNKHLRFDYLSARANRTALDAYREQVGVCRDFAHLAIALLRCLNIPARYVTGYLPDVGVPFDGSPMDFAAAIEVYLEGGWYVRDPRNNQHRIGRIPLAKGRDAADVPITMIFGYSRLRSFNVVAKEIEQPANTMTWPGVIRESKTA